ncbi:galactoside O-acetyltransferase [Luteibacter sp. OK325]|uniref:acyltransferase n=1 Tax=Luteibacter sp. OK325 TaxID=2135670 RepID=UPI000D3496E5|nr:acyltransferase [Luteibacter sp. OK325]PTR26305.1 galactoside O-acetyltransferase [Luteibacter sp. OK325]
MENPFLTRYLVSSELRELGFKSVGEKVLVAANCTIVGAENIEIGDNVRIDPYTTITAGGSGWLKVGSHVHIAGYALLSAGDGIEMEDFSGISQGVRVYSRTDDYTGKALTNPTVPAEFTQVRGGTVRLGRHVIIGSGTVILPRLTIGEGTSVGALSLVTKSLEPWGVYTGMPATRLKARSQALLEKEQAFLATLRRAP